MKLCTGGSREVHALKCYAQDLCCEKVVRAVQWVRLCQRGSSDNESGHDKSFFDLN